MKINTIDEIIKSNAKDLQDKPLLYALLLDRDGDWDGAHKVAQEVDTSDGALVHAYLHRKEGDISNADYWYRRAQQKRPSDSLDVEWLDLVKKFYKLQK